MRKIEIDDEVYKALLRLAETFKDSPNDILRRMLGLNKVSPEEEKGEEGLEEMMRTVGIKDVPPPKRIIISGSITPIKDYFAPILESLLELGGSASANEVLGRVYEKIKNNLTEMDKKYLPSGNDLRWRNKAQWARLIMVKNGLLKKNSPRGIWEITDSGRNFLKSKGNKV